MVLRLEREKKKALSSLEQEEIKLNKLASKRIGLDSDDLDALLSGFFGKIDFNVRLLLFRELLITNR